MLKIAHLINPAKVNTSSDLHFAQPITFESMRIAGEAANGNLDIDYLAAQFPEDREILPDFIRPTDDLDRSVLDFADFQVPRKLPLLRDILDRGYEATPGTEYMIYTNVDIALMPFFYTNVADIIEDGFDAFVINRRTIPGDYSRVEELPQMYAEAGRAHPGFDCFVFRRDLYPRFALGNVCVGMGWVARTLLTNLMVYASRYKTFSDKHLTFHIGDPQEWKSEKYRDYWVFNRTQFYEVSKEIEAEVGPLDRRKRPGVFIKHVEDEILPIWRNWRKLSQSSSLFGRIYRRIRAVSLCIVRGLGFRI